MQKTTTAIVAAASLAATVIAAPKPAEARCIGCWVGAGIAAAVIGGVFASRAYGYGYGYPAYGYGGYGGYGYPAYSMAMAIRRTATGTDIRRTAMPTRRSCTARTTRRAATMPAGTIATDPCRRRGILLGWKQSKANSVCSPPQPNPACRGFVTIKCRKRASPHPAVGSRLGAASTPPSP